MSEFEILRKLLEYVRQQVNGVRMNEVAETREDLLRVTSELLRGVMSIGDAVFALLDRQQIEATAALERAAWEMSEETQFLLRRDHPDEDATRSRIHAALDVQEHANASDDSGAVLRESVNAQVAEYQRTHAALVEEMRNLRKKRKGLHWSGKTRTDVYAADPPSRTTYKLLSWEAHPIAVGIRDVKIDRDGTAVTVTFPPIENVEALAERVAGQLDTAFSTSGTAMQQYGACGASLLHGRTSGIGLTSLA
jgi:hypothetical protein